MLELVIQVRLSAKQINEKTAKSQGRWLYGCSVIIAAVFVILEWQKMRQSIKFCKDDADYTLILTIVPICVLFFVAISLTVSVSILFRNLNSYYPHDLPDERRRIQMIFIVFSSAFCVKAIFGLFEQLLIKGVSDGDDNFAYFVVVYIMNFFWDMLPLFLVMHYHFMCYSAQSEDTQEESGRDDPLLTTTTSDSFLSSTMVSSSRPSTSNTNTNTSESQAYIDMTRTRQSSAFTQRRGSALNGMYGETNLNASSRASI